MDMTPSERIDLERTKEQIVEMKLRTYEMLSYLISSAKDNPKTYAHSGYKDAGDAAIKLISKCDKDIEKLTTAYEKRWPM